MYFIIFFVYILLMCFIGKTYFRESSSSKALMIILISLLVNLSVLWAVHSDFVLNSYEFFYPDESFFYGAADILSHQKSLSSIWNMAVVEAQFGNGTRMGCFIMGTIGYFFNNSELLQRTFLLLCSSSIPLLVFKLGLRYVNAKSAFFCSVLFALFSYVNSYSCWIFRDIYVMFFSTLLLVLVTGKFSIYRLFFIFSIFIILFLLRPVSGVIVIPLLLYYIFNKRVLLSKRILVVRYISLIVLLFLSPIMLTSFVSSLNVSNDYVDRTLNFQEQSGMAMWAYSLPIGIRNIVTALYSQITPIPFSLLKQK